MSKSSKQDRFERLLDHYAIALHITYQILDSGLLERKIKVGNDSKRIDELVGLFLPSLANDLRRAEKIKGVIKSIDNHGTHYFGSAVDLADAYFTELNTHGGEWEYADLEDLFFEYKIAAEEALEQGRERY